MQEKTRGSRTQPEVLSLIKFREKMIQYRRMNKSSQSGQRTRERDESQKPIAESILRGKNAQLWNVQLVDSFSLENAI